MSTSTSDSAYRKGTSQWIKVGAAKEVALPRTQDDLEGTDSKSKWSLKENITRGAPQGSRVGPLVWNVMYVDFLRSDLFAGTSII